MVTGTPTKASALCERCVLGLVRVPVIITWVRQQVLQNAQHALAQACASVIAVSIGHGRLLEGDSGHSPDRQALAAAVSAKHLLSPEFCAHLPGIGVSSCAR
jgi:hypothetical protein